MDLYIVLLTTMIFIFLIFLYLSLHHHYSTHKNHHYGFKAYPFLGTLPQFVRNRHRFLEWSTDILSRHPTHTSAFIHPGIVHSVMTANPTVVEHILKTNFLNYPKGPRFSYLLYDLLGTGIFNADGELWKHQRKIASFEFNKRSFKTFLLDIIRSDISTRLIPLLKRASAESSSSSHAVVIDMQDVLERFAFDNVCKLAFNVDPGCLSIAGSSHDGSDFMRAFDDATTLSQGRFMYVIPLLHKLKRFLNIGSERRLRESIQTVHKYADNIIRSRLQDMKDGSVQINNFHDLLTCFIESDHGLSHDNDFLRDVVISFILAGRDTTSSGLSWFFWLISLNPGVLEKIRAEVGEVRTRAGKQVGDTFDFDELREMNYLHGALSETLRLYPPVPIDIRTCMEDDVLPDKTKVKSGWLAIYSTYAMGRMKSIWGDDCLEFRPERWLDENGLYKPDNPFRFPVFHAGPRICLGKEMAYIQMKSIVACVVEQFEVDVFGKDKRPEFLLSLTLRMKSGLLVKLREKNKLM